MTQTGYTNPPMARRHLTFTLEFSLDEDTVRDHDVPMHPDGDTQFAETINLLRTALHHQAALILSPFDPELGNPTVDYNGIDYNRAPVSTTDDANF